MTLLQAVGTMLLVMALGALLGITLRCIQEGYRFKTWVYTLFLLSTILFLMVFIPILTPIIMLRDQKFKNINKGLLVIFGTITIPGMMVLTILKFPRLLDTILWKSASDLDRNLRIKKRKQKSNLRVVSPIPTVKSPITLRFITSMSGSFNTQFHKKFVERFAH